MRKREREKKSETVKANINEDFRNEQHYVIHKHKPYVLCTLLLFLIESSCMHATHGILRFSTQSTSQVILYTFEYISNVCVCACFFLSAPLSMCGLLI